MTSGSFAAVLLLGIGLSSGLAPFQCAQGSNPDRRREESAPESLYNLAARFREQGDERARQQTLDYLIAQYPTSREAGRAREERTPSTQK